MSMLQSLPEATQQPERHKSSSLVRGQDGTNSSATSTSAIIPSSQKFQKDNEQSSCLSLEKQSEKAALRKNMESPWYVAQSRPPWAMYLRPSERLTDQTPGMMKGESLIAFHNNSSRAIKMRTRIQNKRKISLSKS